MYLASVDDLLRMADQRWIVQHPASPQSGMFRTQEGFDDLDVDRIRPHRQAGWC
jgi:hypothetical protein